MKHSDIAKTLRPPGSLCTILLWATPLALTVPNFLLSLGEPSYTLADRMANVALPLGIYFLVAALFRSTGLGVLLCIPLMVLGGFEIVIHDLYGEGIIAIDMFLNVLTTNSREAGELLGNLVGAMAAVVLLYVPVIVIAVLSLFRGGRVHPGSRRAAFIAGGILTFAGAVTMGFAFAKDPLPYAPDRKLFPVNVISNIFAAGHRNAESDSHECASSGFQFHATPTHPDGPEIYVMVIGETSRAGNWELNGYPRPTNPRLSRRPGIISFDHALSESNTTHKSVPLLMSHLAADQFGDSIYAVKSIITAFGEAGFRTGWFSNQQRNRALIDAFGLEADTARFLTDDGGHRPDMDLAQSLADMISTTGPDEKIFVVLHTYGSHFNYRDRYPDTCRPFTPDDAFDASEKYRPALLNAYDNSIAYTDAVLDSVISVLDTTGRPAAMLYIADHGEDIFDDDRGRFLHASPTPTFWQLHVPVVAWMSEQYRQEYPERNAILAANVHRQVSSSRSAFNTMLGIAGIKTPRRDPAADLSDPAYTEPIRVFLDDYDEAVPLPQSGLRPNDFVQLSAKGIR